MLQGIKTITADDDEMSLEMLATILVSQGVDCTQAINGREAMEALESNPEVDILLLDLQMPVMDGFEVIAQCKGNPYLSDIPIIVLASDHHDKLKALKLGADDFIAKPYDLEELELRIIKLVQSRRLAQSAKLAKNEFLAIANHELRTPMHQITGLAELLDGKGLAHEQHEIVDLLKQAAGNLTEIIRDIINYVQLDHGSARSAAEPFHLRATVQSALESQQEAAGRGGSSFKLSIGDEVADALNGPAFYVYKVISILAENAVRFSPGGDIAVTIREESFGSHDSRFHGSVRDHGIGIPAEFHESIFEPFVQVDSSSTRKVEGIGLGLAIAKRMVELMGGTIGVRNNDGGGCSFEFSFQCHRQQLSTMLH